MRRLAVPLLLSAICLSISYFGFFYFRDNFSTHYPIKVFTAESFRSGELPWWNFADGGGQPLAGNPNALTFYPDNILYLFLPAHVAFNIHFFIHLIAAWFAMRALGNRFAAWLYVLCGLALSATAFYTLITAVALIPFAFWAVERRSALMLGTAFGLMALATEPVTILATAIAVAILAFGNMRITQLLTAAAISILIASPQLIAYSEIASEVERARGFSAETTLNASLAPQRLVELVVGPVFPPPSQHLFLTLFVGAIVLPALFIRSRYRIVAVLMLFLALGRYNPLVAVLVKAMPSIRIGRYPEKFMMVCIPALIVLSAIVYDRSKEKRYWLLATFLPLVVWLPLNVFIDLYAPYRAQDVTPSEQRVFIQGLPGGQVASRADYRIRAQHRDALFGMVTGLQYALTRSPDNMHSILSRIALERWTATMNPHWLAIATAPPVTIIPHAVGVKTIDEAVKRIESANEHVASSTFDSAPAARILSYARKGQTIYIDVAGPALVMVNQSYFRSWIAREGSIRVPTAAVDLDRLGVVIPAGTHHIELRFGRRRTFTIAAWLVSSLMLLASMFVSRIPSVYPERSEGSSVTPAAALPLGFDSRGVAVDPSSLRSSG